MHINAEANKHATDTCLSKLKDRIVYIVVATEFCRFDSSWPKKSRSVPTVMGTVHVHLVTFEFSI